MVIYIELIKILWHEYLIAYFKNLNNGIFLEIICKLTMPKVTTFTTKGWELLFTTSERLRNLFLFTIRCLACSFYFLFKKIC